MWKDLPEPAAHALILDHLGPLCDIAREEGEIAETAFDEHGVPNDPSGVRRSESSLFLGTGRCA